jgi:UDP-2,3-diacylglucosamine pyrophosphatase LpxH
MERFDEVHVVSDLHLGGCLGHQIFRGTELLAGLLDQLAQRPEKRRVAFVINGDFVDFLAEPGATHFDPAGAADKLDRISRDPSFAPIWEALRRFVAQPDRTLVIVLGNHDIELAMPRVQEAFLASICQGQDAARGRVRLCTLGTGFAARVGDKRVLCLHGNECDEFNVTDYETLRRAARNQTYGFAPERWIPNAGTQLVIDLMNNIKFNLPFVDLLKPEDDAVVPLLVAMKQVTPERLIEVFEVAARTVTDNVKQGLGLLSASEQTVNAQATQVPAARFAAQDRALATLAVLEPTLGLGAANNRPSEDFRIRLLDEIEGKFEAGDDPLDAGADALDSTLGLINLVGAAWRATIAAIRGGDETEVVRAALKHLLRDRSFDIKHPDETFKKLDALVPSDIEVLIAGHTHLERAHSRSTGTQYINTGTWARLVQIDPDVLSDTHDDFAALYRALKSSSLSDLDAAKLPNGRSVVNHQPAMASVEATDAGVRVELRRVMQENHVVSWKVVSS